MKTNKSKRILVSIPRGVYSILEEICKISEDSVAGFCSKAIDEKVHTRAASYKIKMRKDDEPIDPFKKERELIEKAEAIKIEGGKLLLLFSDTDPITIDPEPLPDEFQELIKTKLI